MAASANGLKLWTGGDGNTISYKDLHELNKRATTLINVIQACSTYLQTCEQHGTGKQ